MRHYSGSEEEARGTKIMGPLDATCRRVGFSVAGLPVSGLFYTKHSMSFQISNRRIVLINTESVYMICFEDRTAAGAIL